MNEQGNKKILIIEDEKPLAHALLIKLSHEGFVVTTTGSGQEGIDFLKKEHFDLVLTDLIIPGVDGFKILEMMKENKIATPVMVITNLNQDEDKKRVFDLGATDFFVKSNSPISEIVLHIKNKLGVTVTISTPPTSSPEVVIPPQAQVEPQETPAQAQAQIQVEAQPSQEVQPEASQQGEAPVAPVQQDAVASSSTTSSSGIPQQVGALQ